MNRMMITIAALALCGAVLASFDSRLEALAQDKQDAGGKGKEGEGAKGAPKAPSLSFSQIDANGDGQISKAEWLSFFAKLDANKDSLISAKEAAGTAAPATDEGGSKKKGGDGAGKKGGDGK